MPPRKRPAAAVKTQGSKKRRRVKEEEAETPEGAGAEEDAEEEGHEVDQVVDPDTLLPMKGAKKAAKKREKPKPKRALLVAGEQDSADRLETCLRCLKEGQAAELQFADDSGGLLGKALLQVLSLQCLPGHAVAEAKLLAKAGRVPKLAKALGKDTGCFVHLCKDRGCAKAPLHPKSNWLHAPIWRPVSYNQCTSPWTKTKPTAAWVKKQEADKKCRPDLVTTVPSKSAKKKAAKGKQTSKNKLGQGSSSKAATAEAKKEEEEVRQALKAVADAEVAEDLDDRTPVMNLLSKKVKGAEDADTAEVTSGATGGTEAQASAKETRAGKGGEGQGKAAQGTRPSAGDPPGDQGEEEEKEAKGTSF